MISFISETLLKEEPLRKFMLNHEIKNYFRPHSLILAYVLLIIFRKKIFLNNVVLQRTVYITVIYVATITK